MTHQPPAPYPVPDVLHGTRFLVNGKLESWTGPSSEVRSPILSETKDGTERTLLGSVPDLPAEEGIRALEAACNASEKDLVEGIVRGGHSEFSSMNYLL